MRANGVAGVAAGVKRRRRVVRDSEVVPPAGPRAVCHDRDSRTAVRVLGVAVQHAANVGWLDERRHASPRGKLKLASALAHLRCDEWKAGIGGKRRFIPGPDAASARGPPAISL